MHALLYCHNVHGLGHIVRSSQIAAAVVDAGGRATIVTGCAALATVPIDPRVSVVWIPPIRLVSLMRLEAIDAGLVDADIMRVRAERILDAARQAIPDVVLTDLLPLGLRGELLPTLTAARAERWPTAFVWGIPYIDTSIADARPPRNPAILAGFRLYESAIAYEDASVADVFQNLPAWVLPARRGFVGVVASDHPRRGVRTDGLVVVTCGGGTTAPALCRAVMAAKHLLPPGGRVHMRIVAGPLADLAEIQAIVSNEPGVDVVGAATLNAAVPDAHVIVSRAGYNNAAQLLQTDFPLIFVPYAGGSGDQTARMRRLGERPGVQIVEEGPECPAQLANATVRALDGPPAFARQAPTRSGAAEAARWLSEAAARASAR